MHNEQQFIMMRTRILQQPTVRQSQVMIYATRADIPDYPTDHRDSRSTDQLRKREDQNVTKVPRLIIHYTHEKRFYAFQRDMHLIYKNTFKNTPVENVRLIVGYRNRRDAKHELIRKRPQRKLLKNQVNSSEYTSRNFTLLWRMHNTLPSISARRRNKRRYPREN